MKMASQERTQALQDVRNIPKKQDRERSKEELKFELTNNNAPDARLLALRMLNNMSSLSVDTLIETVSTEHDLGIQMQAINYLIKKKAEDPRIESFLSTFFDNHMKINNL